MNISLAFSTCPNDTFMMYAIAHKKIHLHTINFDVVMTDISELNSSALQSEYDVTKSSAAILPLIAQNYVVLKSGAAFGLSGGPVLVAYETECITNNPIIAIPGEYTTAHLLLKKFLKFPYREKQMIFSEILDSLSEKTVDAGVVIHEDRFIYKDRGFKEIIDFGKKWNETYQLPVPLGVFLVKKNIGEEKIHIINSIIMQSILYAKNNYDEVMEWVKFHAQNQDNEIVNKHINYYVNDLSVDISITGKIALEQLHNYKGKSLILHPINSFYNIEVIQ